MMSSSYWLRTAPIATMDASVARRQCLSLRGNTNTGLHKSAPFSVSNAFWCSSVQTPSLHVVLASFFSTRCDWPLRSCFVKACNGAAIAAKSLTVVREQTKAAPQFGNRSRGLVIKHYFYFVVKRIHFAFRHSVTQEENFALSELALRRVARESDDT